MDVAIVGAGPAGVTLAYLLARRGVGVTLLERQTDFEREFRGEALLPSGVEALKQMGLGPVLDAVPVSRAARAELHLGTRKALEVDLTGASGEPAGPLFVSQPALLEALVAEFEKFPSARTLRGFTVRDVVRKNGRVCGVRGDSAEGPGEVAADYVIGADGRASIMRKRSSLDRPGMPHAFDVVWFKVPLPDFLAKGGGTLRAYLGPSHFCIMFPAADGRLQVAWVIDKGAFGELRRRGIEEWLGELRGHVSPDLAAHLEEHREGLSHPFLLDVICDHLDVWSEPGLLLIGDASHPMSPVGAQGINIALRDTVVAANRLGPVLTSGASPEEIDAAARRVVAERLPEVRTIQRMQRTFPRIVFQRTGWSRFLVGRLVPQLARTPILPWLFGMAFRRIAQGTTTVTLDD